MMDTVAQLRATRRYLTGVLLNLDIEANLTTVGQLQSMLDHFCEYPNDYLELVNEHNKYS